MAQLQPGTEVWAEHPQSKEWVRATVITFEGDAVSVKLDDGGETLEATVDQCQHQNRHVEGGREDLTLLDYLIEPGKCSFHSCK